MNHNFYIYHQKYCIEQDKTTDWFIKSRELKGIDKDLAKLYCKKHDRLAVKYIKLANKYLHE